jgi:CBS domain-containing protein
MRAIDIGTSRVIQLNESCPVAEAVQAMHQHDVGSVVVVKNTLEGVLPSGIVTDRDLVVRFLSNGQTEATLLRDISSYPLVTCWTDATIDELIAIMLGSHVRRLPIVDNGGHLVGIVSLDDITAALAELMQRVAHVSASEFAMH